MSSKRNKLKKCLEIRQKTRSVMTPLVCTAPTVQTEEGSNQLTEREHGVKQ